jgi:hypothetical protein
MKTLVSSDELENLIRTQIETSTVAEAEPKPFWFRVTPMEQRADGPNWRLSCSGHIPVGFEAAWKCLQPEFERQFQLI